MKVILKIQNENYKFEVPLMTAKVMSVGRAKHCDISVPDNLISSNHCQITFSRGYLELVDSGSKNGTFLNGLRVKKCQVFIGDVILIGQTKLSLAREAMDGETIRSLSFKGEASERMANEIQVESAPSVPIDSGTKVLTPLEREILTSKPKPKARLSKQTVRRKNPVKSTIASVIDTLCFFGVVAIPLLVINIIQLADLKIPIKKSLLLATSEALMILLFYFVNFRRLRYTVGEKLSGIQAATEDQP